MEPLESGLSIFNTGRDKRKESTGDVLTNEGSEKCNIVEFEDGERGL